MAALCQQDSPLPAMQVQNTISSLWTMSQSYKGFSLSFCEWRTWDQNKIKSIKRNENYITIRFYFLFHKPPNLLTWACVTVWTHPSGEVRIPNPPRHKRFCAPEALEWCRHSSQTQIIDNRDILYIWKWSWFLHQDFAGISQGSFPSISKILSLCLSLHASSNHSKQDPSSVTPRVVFSILVGWPSIRKVTLESRETFQGL